MSYIALNKPHAVLIPFPFQSHILSFLKIAKLLHLRGFHITFVNTEHNHKRLLKSKAPNSLNGFTDFVFETIPDGLSTMDADGDGDVHQDLYPLCESIRIDFLKYMHEVLARLQRSSNDGLIPPVTCLVSDCFMPFSVQAAEELSLPIALLCPVSACCLLSIMHIRTMFDKGLIPLKDESYLTNGYLDTKVDWIPSMKNFRLKDINDIIRTTDPNDFMLQFLMEVADIVPRASTILINTYNQLESDALNDLNSMLPSLYTIGPLPSFLNQSPQNSLTSSSGNLWKEDSKCLEWLENKEHFSVLYVNFGSTTIMSPDQLLEFAWGLSNSKKPFLWIIRPDLVIGSSAILSSEFVNEISARGLIASWCPQEKVLNHPSIGGFLTHCGWNSTLESICGGVPMLCWPFFADQPTNCRCICYEWDIGIEIDCNVKREEVEQLINELLVGEKGKKIRKNIIELKKKAEEDTRVGGCSYMNLDKVIKEVLLKQ